MSLQRHRRRATYISAAALSATLLTGGRAWAADGYHGQDTSTQADSAQERITLELDDAPFTTAINLIQKKTGIQVVIEGSTQNFGRVNLSLRGRPVNEALHLVAASAGADLWEEDGIYYIGPKGSAPRPVSLLPMADPMAAPEPASWRLEKIRLQYTAPSYILRMLGIDNRDEPDVMNQLRLSALRQIVNPDSDGTSRPNFGPGVPVFMSPNGQSQVAPAAPNTAVPVLSPNSAATRGASSNPVVGGSGGVVDQGAQRDGGDGSQEFGRGQGFGGAGGAGGFGGQGPGGGGGAGGFGGQGGAGGGGVGGAQGGGANAAALLPPGLTGVDINAVDADNSLLLRYQTPLQLKQFRQLIQLLDIKPKQVLVKSQFVTVTQNDVDSFGINWNFTKVNLVAAANAGFSSTNTAFIQYAAGNLQTALSWILTTGRGKVVTSPSAVTLNGIPAQFINNQEEPVLVQQPIIGINGNVVLSTTIVEIAVTTQLTVVPYINGDGTITLAGNVSYTDITGSITNPAGGTIPIIETQAAKVTRIIRDGDTMVISGLVRKRDTVSTNRVPLLGDLPLVGTLFRSRDVTTDDSELLVFITAEILNERPSNSASATGAASTNGQGLLP